MNTTTNTSQEPVITWKLETKLKELTDEEIDNIYSDIFGYKPIDNSAVYFAKAILKKAQKK